MHQDKMHYELLYLTKYKNIKKMYFLLTPVTESFNLKNVSAFFYIQLAWFTIFLVQGRIKLYFPEGGQNFSVPPL